MRRSTLYAIVIAILVSSGGCARGGAEEPTGSVTSGGESSVPARVATARLESAEGREPVEGTVTFTEQEGGGVLVEVNVDGLAPGQHGFHVHEVGECAPPGFESAGGHFAAEGERHGAPTDREHHLGDLGNIEVPEEGPVRYTIRADGLSLDEGSDTSIVGKSIVIHEKRDDFETQPSGDSGARVACGVIRGLD